MEIGQLVLPIRQLREHSAAFRVTLNQSDFGGRRLRDSNLKSNELHQHGFIAETSAGEDRQSGVWTRPLFSARRTDAKQEDLVAFYDEAWRNRLLVVQSTAGEFKEMVT